MDCLWRGAFLMTGIMCAMLGSPSGSVASVTASAAPTYLSKTRTGSGIITSDPVTVTAAGGVGPYTYAWSRVAGDTYTVNAPSSATTTFTTTVSAGTAKSASYRCIVTDSLGNNAFVDVTVEFEAF